jgi:hypothetical protein
MPTSTFYKFDKFVLNKGKKVFNLATDQLKIALTNTAPTKATDNQYSDIVSPVATTNMVGTTAALDITTTSFTQTSGTSKLILVDLTVVASGAVGPFQYAVLYDDTATNKELIGYYDYASSITLAAADTFKVDFDGSAGVITEA